MGTNPDPDRDPDANVTEPTGFTPCMDGMAGNFPCSGYDLVARLDLDDLGAGSGNDIWGWADPADGTEYALVGLDNGTAFVSLENPENPVYLGKLPTQTVSSAWRDIKVYRNHAYIVSEAGGHGMQVFDLTALRGVTSPPVTFSPTFEYTAFGNAHNLVIEENTGYAYAVGTGPVLPYQGGPHFIDLGNPALPVDAGGYSGAGYTHDAQVVLYQGPDADYSGREILVGANETRVVILDVTDKDQPVEVAGIGYPNLGYPHQGWFSEDQRYFILGDEVDELNFGFNSRTIVFDFQDLDNPVISFTYSGPTTAIDHNGYVLGDRFFLANYTAGVRIVDISGLDAQQMTEVGSFDTYPGSDSPAFSGAWSVYPYLPSGLVLIGDIDRGLFVIQASETTP
ncbi:choice-of-anchor B family protein [Robiginitalea sp. SC105]|nr:choice-of-anchor B family protein [Robiginitalea sp. SC105]MBC2838364.1 choice-of-anchor B family protein [Robiginitalea sp. SC105]